MTTQEKIERFHPESESSRIIEWIKKHVGESQAKGAVFGLSGGVDSAVVAFLTVRALGPERTMGVLLFEESSRNSTDYKDAKEIGEVLKIKTVDLSISNVFDSFLKSLGQQNIRVSKITAGNLKARIRMCFIYSIANENNLVVVGTGDRSESLIGYFTKYGDGGADLFPIVHLYKTEVRILADYLGVPHGVVTKPSSPNLWEGHKAIDEIPAEYDVMDSALVQLFDERKTREIVSKNTGLTMEKISEIVLRNEKSSHKRELPKSMER